MSQTPRPEYPRPQFARADWQCLNGPWQFEIDYGNSGLQRGLRDRPLSGEITVPFCPESELSGVGHVDFMRAVWYRREIEVPGAWRGRRVLLHFQAIDYDATIWCDGKTVGRHRGGATPITCDLGDVGGQTVTVVARARDLHDGPAPRGKQSDKYANHGCHYTRTTGIWQTVWMEPVPTPALRRPRVTPDLANGAFHVEQPIDSPHRADMSGLRYSATLTDGGDEVCRAECAVADFSPRLTLPIPAHERRPWSIDDPHLYDLKLELLDAGGNVLDAAESYAGLRSVTIDGRAIKINGKSVFQRLVLDQGYYPDGILTAPSDEALVRDIELSMAAGFNGARLHQKVFEERFLYHADRMGYLCWGEFPDWGCMAGAPPERPLPGPTYVTQWLECLERDYNHPSLVGWCPMNEQTQPEYGVITDLDDVIRGMYLATKAFDLTRPVLDASGWVHRVPETDVYDSHDYEQDPAKFKENHAGLARDEPLVNTIGQSWNTPYAGQPYFVSEFGGIWWNPEAAAADEGQSWGYGARPKTEAEFLDRFDGLCAVLLQDPKMFGYCYTQLTDVYQEQNGVYRFDRRPKVDEAGMRRIRDAQQRPAAIEQTGEPAGE